MPRRAGLLMLLLLTLPAGATADDLTPPNGNPYYEPCDSQATRMPTDPNFNREDTIGIGESGPGRYYVCVSDGKTSNKNELYIGGDFTTIGTARQCFHVEVAGVVIVNRPNYPGGNPDRFCHA